MAKMGRPSIYNKKLADRICQLVATHPLGLRRLCAMFPELPDKETINAWRWEKEDFSRQYTIAKQFQAEMLAESLEDVVSDLDEHRYTDNDNGATKIDGGMIAQARLLSDTRKWTASKLAPKIYGDKQQIENLNADNDKLKEDIAELQKKLLEQNKKEY
jgi:hypothetical protein